MVKRRTISNSFLPAGVSTCTSSPTLRLRRARPMGDVVEIIPFSTSASSLLTSLYSISWLFGIDVALALLGVLVLGVFGEVPVGASYSNLPGKVDVEFVLQRVNFLLELLFNFGKRVRHNFPRQRKMMRSPAWPDSAENIIDGGEMSRQEGKGTETAHI